MASWLGYSTTSFFHAPSTISLPLRSDSNDSSTKANSRSLLSICKSSTPPCKLSPILPGGHAQTIFAALTKRPLALLHYKRRVFTSNSDLYPGCFAVDFVSRTPAAADVPTVNARTSLFEESEWDRFVKSDGLDAEARKRPMLIALHGISGGSHELYLREVLDPIAFGKATSKEGEPSKEWDALVVNARGCANSPVTGDRLFNARATWDIKQLVDWLSETFPDRKLFGVGFSLGGNIMVNYLGEEGVNTPLSGAVICSNPWNLDVGDRALQRSYIGRELYSKSLATNMKKLFEKNVKSIAKNPNVDIEKIRATKYLHEFDRELQGPTWGYPTEGAYYRDASSTDPLLSVRVPTFALHADDDPVASKEAVPYEETKQNPHVVLCTTAMGGHLGWFESGEGRWFVRTTVNWLRAMEETVDSDALRSQTKNDAAKVTKQVHDPSFEPTRRRLYVQTPGRV